MRIPWTRKKKADKAKKESPAATASKDQTPLAPPQRGGKRDAAGFAVDASPSSSHGRAGVAQQHPDGQTEQSSALRRSSRDVARAVSRMLIALGSMRWLPASALRYASGLPQGTHYGALRKLLAHRIVRYSSIFGHRIYFLTERGANLIRSSGNVPEGLLRVRQGATLSYSQVWHGARVREAIFRGDVWSEIWRFRPYEVLDSVIITGETYRRHVAELRVIPDAVILARIRVPESGVRADVAVGVQYETGTRNAKQVRSSMRRETNDLSDGMISGYVYLFSNDALQRRYVKYCTHTHVAHFLCRDRDETALIHLIRPYQDRASAILDAVFGLIEPVTFNVEPLLLTRTR